MSPDPAPEPGRGALAGIRVVALEQAVAAPLCTRHLADLGAEVIKVERPDGGDFARGYDSVVHGESAYFVWLNYGKRSVVLDLATEAGSAVIVALLGTADVFVHNLGPGAVERLGLGPDRLRERWPALIDCAISAFGGDGPYRDHKGFDLLLQGESGLLAVTGTPAEPARIGISIADISAGMYALARILAALIERGATGRGQALDVAILDGLAEWMTVPTLFERYGSGAPARSGLHHPSIAPYGPYRSAAGDDILVAVQNDGQWTRFCATVLELPEIAGDDRFATNERRVANRPALDRIIADAVAGLETAELVRRLDAADVPRGALNTVAQLVDHPQLVARRRWTEIATPSGPVRAARSVLGSAAERRVPRLGEDTEAVLRELGIGA
jgi:crotonobetainyl-CoA:carnitine CoA-transferase CaiB-like acyl-CoA transferase